MTDASDVSVHPVFLQRGRHVLKSINGAFRSVLLVKSDTEDTFQMLIQFLAAGFSPHALFPLCLEVFFLTLGCLLFHACTVKNCEPSDPSEARCSAKHVQHTHTSRWKGRPTFGACRLSKSSRWRCEGNSLQQTSRRSWSPQNSCKLS